LFFAGCLRDRVDRGHRERCYQYNRKGIEFA
jgi:hypothetical protein